MTVLGVDIGTTRSKVALFTLEGDLVRRASRETPTTRGEAGTATHDPARLWETVARLIREVAAGHTVRAVGIGSMAEAGLLVDRATGEPRTPILAWFDTRATEQAEQLASLEGAPGLFQRSGLHASFKFGLPKLLWLEERHPGITNGAVWLSVADYVAYRLTGAMATDPTLAARTFAYSIRDGGWDTVWIRRVGLDPSLFPDVLPAGQPCGTVCGPGARATGLATETPVAVSGHDHICSLLAAGIVEPGTLLDSMGTAESLIAVAREPAYGEAALASGLALVPHVLAGRYCWLGGLSASGGSVEWLREIAGSSLSYQELQELVAGAGEGPSGILYYPYLLGSGAPHPDRRVRAAFLGLRMEHGRGHLFRAVLEGASFEAESIRRAIQDITATPIEDVIAMGGGTRNPTWMQIKADVSGCRHLVSPVEEATALGAALIAALGGGALPGLDAVVDIALRLRTQGRSVRPDPAHRVLYGDIYSNVYLPFATSLRQQSAALGSVMEQGRFVSARG